MTDITPDPEPNPSRAAGITEPVKMFHYTDASGSTGTGEAYLYEGYHVAWPGVGAEHPPGIVKAIPEKPDFVKKALERSTAPPITPTPLAVIQRQMTTAFAQHLVGMTQVRLSENRAGKLAADLVRLAENEATETRAGPSEERAAILHETKRLLPVLHALVEEGMRALKEILLAPILPHRSTPEASIEAAKAKFSAQTTALLETVAGNTEKATQEKTARITQGLEAELAKITRLVQKGPKLGCGI